MGKVIVYVDGFNLFHGLKAKYRKKYHWLDLEALARSFLLSGQVLVQVNYFTAPVRNDSPALWRQQKYWKALDAACPQVRIAQGRFQEKQILCRSCKTSWRSYEEKESDVNLAVTLVEDAARGRYDTAVIISADSDLVPAVRVARRLLPDARFIAAFPPKRNSGELSSAVDGRFTIGDQALRRSQLPDPVLDAAGRQLHRPQRWR